MTAPADFNRTRAAFMQRLSHPSVPSLAFKLGWLIAFRYANRDTQTAYPAQTTLAADLGTSIRTVQRLLDILERHGLVVTPGGAGRGQASRYWIDPQRVTPVTPFPARKGRHPTTKKGDKALSPEPSKRTKGGPTDPPLERERDALTRDDSPGDGGRPDGAAPQKKGKEESGLPRKEESDSYGELRAVWSRVVARAMGARLRRLVERQRRRAAWGRRSRSEARRPALFSFSRPGGGESDSYAELRTVWTRPWPDDPQADRRAWEVALRDGADPAVILAAARAWVAAIEPRFLPVLAKWLGACGWQKPPPAKRSRGNGSRRGKGKADLSRLALLAGGYEEDPDGELFWPGGSVQ